MGLIYFDGDNNVVGTLDVQDGRVIATGQAEGVEDLVVVEPDTYEILQPEDGDRWLDAVRYLYPGFYLTAEWEDDAVEVAKIGNERSGFRGHRGRPGQRGGSLPRSAMGEPVPPELHLAVPAKTPPDDLPVTPDIGARDLLDYHETAQRLGIDPDVERALLEGMQEYARDVNAAAGKSLKWTVKSGGYGQMLGITVSSPEGGRLQFEFNGRDKSLYIAYVRVPNNLQHHGLGRELVNTVQQMAVGAKASAIDFHAVSTGGYGAGAAPGSLVGAYVWAKMGAPFKDSMERQRVFDKYQIYLEREAPLKSSLNPATVQPLDIANEVINGVPVGRNFLVNEAVDYDVRIGQPQ